MLPPFLKIMNLQKAPMMEAKNSMLYESEKIEQAKAILQPYILRRLKSDVRIFLPGGI